MEEQIVLGAIKEFEQLMHRKSDQDCYDPDNLHPVSSDLPYVYQHWKPEDVMFMPYNNLSKIWKWAYTNTHCKGHRRGYCVLRVVKNLEPENRGFGKHVDIDFQSKLIASVFEDNTVKLHDGCFWGLQAEKMGGVTATAHAFNPHGAKYDIVFFSNLHFAERFPDGTTVGEYLTKHCYPV